MLQVCKDPGLLPAGAPIDTQDIPGMTCHTAYSDAHISTFGHSPRCRRQQDGADISNMSQVSSDQMIFRSSWCGNCRVRFMLKEARQGSAAASRAAAQAAEEEAAYKRREAQRRLQPCSSADFALLHSELEAWRLAETARIKSAGLSPEDCHQALAHLLHQVLPFSSIFILTQAQGPVVLTHHTPHVAHSMRCQACLCWCLKQMIQAPLSCITWLLHSSWCLVMCLI